MLTHYVVLAIALCISLCSQFGNDFPLSDEVVATNIVANGSVTLDDVTGTGSVVVETVSITPLTDALEPDLVLRYDVGVTVDGSNNVIAWEDQSANNRVVTINNAPSSTGTGVVFDAVNEESVSVAGVTSAAIGTLIVEYMSTSGTVISSGTANNDSTRIATGSNQVWFKEGVNSVFHNYRTLTAPDLNDGTKRCLAIQVTGTGANTDGSLYKIFEGPKGSLAEIYSGTAGYLSTHLSALEIGRLALGMQDYLDGTMFNVIDKEGVAWLLADINAVSSEFN